MPLPVTLKAVVDEMSCQFGESQAYINKQTGELVTLGEEEISLDSHADERHEEVDYVFDPPEWQQAAIEIARNVLNSDDYLQLPDKFEIHEYEIMQRFCRSYEDDNIREELEITIRGSGAFSRFKAVIHRHNIAEDWYRYRDEALEKIAADLLEANGIPFTRETK